MTEALLPIVRLLPAETAHGLTIKALKAGLTPKAAACHLPPTQLAGLSLPTPIGMAAGFDKNAEVITPLLRLGFGFVEAGTVTPRPQSGNPKPRLFRLSEDRAVINRMGFNNKGLDAFAAKFKALPPPGQRLGPVGANIGANKDSQDRIADYRLGVARMAPLADYITVNISSPNTPGLRNLQESDALKDLLDTVLDARAGVDTGGRHVPIFVKISPDLDFEAVDVMAQLFTDKSIDGVIATNTTVARPDSLASRHAWEKGGLSGRPLTWRADAIVKRLFQHFGKTKPIIGVGGLESAADIFRRISLGASAVQMYTALVYGGPQHLGKIMDDLAELLDRDKIRDLTTLVGRDAV